MLQSDIGEPEGEATRMPSRVQSVERAGMILRALAVAEGTNASVAALAETCGLNRTTTWRLLQTLQQQNFVTQDRVTGLFSLDVGLIDLAEHASRATVLRVARLVLRGVVEETGETAGLAIERNGAVTYVAEVDSGAVVTVGWQGRQVPLHATSTGKALLAFADPTELALLLPSESDLTAYTPTTITSQSALAAELAQIRADGFAVCRGEYISSAWGVSAPVLDGAGKPQAVLSIWGPGARLGEDRFAQLGEVARAAAHEVARRQRLPKQGDQV